MSEWSSFTILIIGIFTEPAFLIGSYVFKFICIAYFGIHCFLCHLNAYLYPDKLRPVTHALLIISFIFEISICIISFIFFFYFKTLNLYYNQFSTINKKGRLLPMETFVLHSRHIDKGQAIPKQSNIIPSNILWSITIPVIIYVPDSKAL